ncbi:M14 family metallopeptidase [Shewanella maritima]|uniref:M14 family metallopeptidase n=1 Tax=Shewanella maritima TaxID=2520507 RepID=UPI00373523C6
MAFIRPLYLLVIGLLFFTCHSFAQNSESRIEQYLSQAKIDETITTPAKYLGYPLGEWHLRHDQINHYLQQLAEQSDRVSLDSAGKSYQQRDQLTAVITSNNNQKNLTRILASRADAKTGRQQTGPLIIWLAYSIHGDEASGAHAAMALSHYLSASQDKWVKQLLNNAVVLITPVQNPDGFDRFSTWANNHKGQNIVVDPQHREHVQDWPGGRGNHFFADMNRDWLFLRHDASKGRVAFFHKWQPHMVGDFHEMWHNQSYFFQPGVPERVHPLTPESNQALTNKLAEFHRKALDDVKQVYFSEQTFDDFFYGKGSTYPDINGAIGVLFEQASARGQAQQSDNGVVYFTTAIDNQFTTSISSLQGSLALKDELIQYQQDFYTPKKASKPKVKPRGRLINTQGDYQRRDQLASILQQHQISFFYLNKSMHHAGQTYSPQDSLFIPNQQSQQALLEALFDKRTDFKDATFYDISTWDFASAFALSVVNNASVEESWILEKPQNWHQGSIAPKHWPYNSVALLIDWSQTNAAVALAQLQAKGVQVKFSSKPFSINKANSNDSINLNAGSLQIPLSQDGKTPQQVMNLVGEITYPLALPVTPVSTAHAITGIDLGSDDFITIKPVTPLVITGSGINASEAGELWYYLDRTLGLSTSMINLERLSRVNLSAYSHILLADGNYRLLSSETAKKLQEFVEQGGVIVAQKGALHALKEHSLLQASLQSKSFYQKLFNTDGLQFSQKSELRAKQSIGGAIVGLKFDESHPLGFGLANPLPVMKNKAIAFNRTHQPFSMVAQYQDQPLISGYLAREYQRAFANQAAIAVETQGKGAVVALSDNLLFRNIWLGSEKLYANALYFFPAAVN